MVLAFRECQFLAAVVALSLGDFADRIDRFLEKRDGREFNVAERRITIIKSQPGSVDGWAPKLLERGR